MVSDCSSCCKLILYFFVEDVAARSHPGGGARGLLLEGEGAFPISGSSAANIDFPVDRCNAVWDTVVVAHVPEGQWIQGFSGLHQYLL